MTAHVDPRNLPPGQRVDVWCIVRRIDEGTYGVVYEVEKDGRRFALKLACQLERGGDPLQTDARAQREGVCLQQLKHPNIIRMWACGRWPDSCSGFFYLVLDFVDGYTLAEWTRRTHPTLHEVVALFLPLFEALDYMHGRGIVHRDLSLRNIMVTKQGKPVIIDLGSADYPTAAALTDGPLPPGTPRNRSPEAQRFWRENRFNLQARYTFRATDDIFALGANLYDVLTDPDPELPRERPPLNDELLPPPSPFKATEGRVPEALSAYVMTLLRADPEQRPQTGKDAGRPLTEFVQYEGPEWRVNLLHPVEKQLLSEPEDAAPSPAEASDAQEPEVPVPSHFPAEREPAPHEEAVVVKADSGAVVSAGPRQRRHGPWAAGVLALAILVAAGGSLLLARAALDEKPTNHPTRLPSARPTQQETSPSVNQPETSSPPPAASRLLNARFMRLLSKREQCMLLVGMLEWSEMGCASVPLRPESGYCPIESIQAMDEQLGWAVDESTQFLMTVDVTKGRVERWGEGPHLYTVFTDGPVTGALEKQVGKAPPGTLLKGHLWTEANEKLIYGRYFWAILPDGRKVPICVELRVGRQSGIDKIPEWGSKPGHAVGLKTAGAWAVLKWGL